MSAVFLLGLAAAGIFAVAAVAALRQPLLARLAFRSAARRPTEAALVVLGSLLGTAIITGSLIVGDTLDASIQSDAWTRLGPIDEVIAIPGHDSAPALREALAGLEQHPDIDGTLVGLRASGTAVARTGTAEAAAKPGVTLLEMDFAEARRFGGDVQATGLGETPAPAAGQAAVSSELADRIGVGDGDRITVYAYGTQIDLEVRAVLPRVGVAGYSSSPGSFNAFLAPGTLEGLLAAAPPGLEAAPVYTLGLISNTGGVIEGAERTDAAIAAVRERLSGFGGVEVDPTKRLLLEEAERVGGEFGELFLSIGMFAILAGALLLVNIFVMLAEERKPELGMMRAVGMRRGQLVRSFLIEGFIYALTAAVVGTVLGMGIGAVIVRVAAGIFGSGDWSLDLRYTASPASLAIGFFGGTMIALVTVLATSLRISRLNIIRSIRELPDPALRKPRLRTLLAATAAVVVGGAWAAASFAGDEPNGTLAAPGLLAIGLATLGSRLAPKRVVVSVLGMGVVVWGVLASTVVPRAFDNADTPTFVVQGVLLTFAAVAVLGQNQDLLGRGLRALSGRQSLAARIGVAYPLARRFRTSSTLGMYALVIFTLVFISVFSATFGGQVDRLTADESGGYSLLVNSSATDPLPASAAGSVEGVSAVAPLRFAAFSVEFKSRNRPDFEPWALSGFDEELLRHGPPALGSWVPDYPDQASVWRAVLHDPSLMIIDAFFLQRGGPQVDPVRPGETVEMRDPLSGRTETRRVVAQTKGGFSFSGPFVSQEGMLAVLGPRAAPSRLYVATAPGVDIEALAQRLQAEFVTHGVEAESFRTVVERQQLANLQFFRLMQGYLALGLVVGISGLGVVMVRAVRERRREVGMLRALGVQPETVRRSFLLESGFVAAQGLAVGAVLSLVTAYQLFANANVFGEIDVAFTIPWGELALLLGLTLAASLLATAWPARQASRIRPAVALRIAD